MRVFCIFQMKCGSEISLTGHVRARTMRTHDIRVVATARVMKENEHVKGKTLSMIIDDLSLFSPLSEFDSRPVVRRV